MSTQKNFSSALNSENSNLLPPFFGPKIYMRGNSGFVTATSDFLQKTMLCRLRSSRPLLLVAVVLILLLYSMSHRLLDYSEPISASVWTISSERNLTVYVRPAVSTALLSPHTPCAGDEFLVVVVPSSPRNWERRKAIRSTYGRWLQRLSDDESFTRSLLKLELKRAGSNASRRHTVAGRGRRLPDRKPEVYSWKSLAINVGNSGRHLRAARLLNEMGAEGDHPHQQQQAGNGPPSPSPATAPSHQPGHRFIGGQATFAALNLTLNTRLFFLLGRENSLTSMSAALMNEQEIYGDVILEDFIDSYQNLTLKSVFMLKFISRSCPSAKFVVKADDDVFLHVPNIERTLVNKNPADKLILGCLFCFVRPVTNPSSKWFSPSHMFRGHFFPNYVSGTSYVLSGSVVGPLLGAAMRIPLFHLEDVYITGILAQDIRVRPQDDMGFSYQTRPPNPCLYQNVSMAHDMEPVLMYKLWNLLNLDGMTRSCKALTASQVRRYSPPTNCKWSV